MPAYRERVYICPAESGELGDRRVVRVGVGIELMQWGAGVMSNMAIP
jgi:hypothetical protein